MKQFPRLSCLCQKLLFGGAIATLAVGSLLAPASSSSSLPTPSRERSETQEKPSNTLDNSPKAVVDEVWQLVNSEFVDKEFNHRDWQKKRQELLSRDYANPKQAYKAIQDALQELGDPYTRFLAPDEFKMLTSQTSGEFTGVGLRLAVDKRTSDLIVIEPIKNSPAMKAGIKPGDRILRINGKPTALMSLEEASKELEGEVGSQVNLQVAQKDKGIVDVSLTRVEMEVPSVSYNLRQEGQIKVGYIKIDDFSSHAAEQTKQAIEDLGKQQVKGYVLDLRGNPGGLLFASVDIARMWMEKGDIVHIIDRQGGDRKTSANGTALTNLPLVVLVDDRSASASEILAGALKENKRATVVGTTTYGKGTVQSVHELSDGSGLAVTVARYYPPSMTDINHKGIKPDINLDLTMEQQLRLKNDPSLMGTGADPHYERAVSVLRTHNLSRNNPSSPQPMSSR
ncbi:MAG: PDZ domain-containing protein [Hydrococcus sp. C42_A2020_068]|uniref:carboxyl-terminal processing protease CtpB n=1 Tax=Pleurocapsa sp. PCC 7327 TaxID=118163 RepID=UPI00029FFC31|nr:carboxyl-terminal processing protease CtpB [Pleurocapsa sp. PCC 7327]AFY77469.1 C-terminal processing peptidase [Pleurocapsa sp. PCC 7327]MBF2019955.1 PDZ domain-containing protein [Hydrococcus sp. C42_A2020_068]